MTLIGTDAVRLSRSDQYQLHQPIKAGAFNVSKSYSIQQCIDDFKYIIEKSIERDMKLPAKNFEHFNCILVIPDQCVKIHTRQMVTALFELGFKSMFLHQESVLSTYAMALPTAVVVDIGSTKTSVCCIEEGIIIARSIIRKNFGGDD